jgi:hypothetical protein
MSDISSLAAAMPETSVAELNARRLTASHPENLEMREQFTKFAGQTFFGQLLASMRKTVDEPAYFHGGKAEEVFQSQMDQILGEKLTAASAEQFIQPMWELMSLQRR